MPKRRQIIALLATVVLLLLLFTSHSQDRLSPSVIKSLATDDASRSPSSSPPPPAASAVRPQLQESEESVPSPAQTTGLTKGEKIVPSLPPPPGNDETIEGLTELLEVIHTPYHQYFVHLDASASVAVHSLLANRTRGYDNVHLIDKRYRSSWGHPIIVHAELELLNAARIYNVRALQRGEPTWQYSIVLDGTSYPLHPMHVLEQKLSTLHPKDSVLFKDSFLTICRYGAPAGDKAGDPCNATKARCLDKECTKQSHTPGNAVVYKGPQWVILSWPYSRYVLDHPHLHDWLTFFMASHAPDELFFPTLAMDSPEFRDHALLYDPPRLDPSNPDTRDPARYVNKHKLGGMLSIWGDCLMPMTQRMRFKWSPCDLGVPDRARVLADDHNLFVRKIKPNNVLKQILRRERLGLTW
ncbi:hypothetical protein RI367_006937 [Sorochytrium milnesiophthora]